MLKRLNYFPLLLLILFVSSCSLYEEVEMLGVQSYEFESAENSMIKASVVFKINNPNFYSINFKKSDFHVFLDKDELGTAGMVKDMKILKKTEKDYTLELLINQNDLEKMAMPLIKKALFQKMITFKITGQAKCKVWGIFGKKIDINESKEISIKELIAKFQNK